MLAIDDDARLRGGGAMRRPPLAYVRSRSDRASVAATAILQIVSDAALEPDLPPGELHCRLWRYLHDEFDDVEATIAAYQRGSR